jgi:hypothetical protein
MRRAEFAGVLRGEALARAYANLDLFVFPPQTDTFGNVVLEAQASGVPCLVSSRGGPRSIIQTGADTCASGMVADTPREFLEATLELMSQPERLNRMRGAAITRAREFSWGPSSSGSIRLTKIARGGWPMFQPIRYRRRSAWRSRTSMRLCAALGGLGSGLMGAIYPALRAAGQDAVDALNYK